MSEQHTTRKTPTTLLFKVIFLTIIFNLLYIAITFVGDMVEAGQQNMSTTIMKYDTIIDIVLTIIQVGIVLYIFIKWANQSYLIKDDFVSYFSGIIFKKQQKVNISNIDSISYEQSFFGKIFKYGTVKFEYGKDQKMIISDIPYPEEFVRTVEDLRNLNRKN
jgi:uncharacterized membrane protein YdbT with pleckstrin-like domain